jgi:hypothetical protein
MMCAFQSAERFDTYLEPGAVTVVESQEANEGAKSWPRSGNGPVRNQVEFGLGGAVTVGGDVVANVLDAVSKKLTLFQLKGNTVFEEDGTHTAEVVKQSGEGGRPE